MKHILISLCLLAPVPALAENLCDVTDPSRLADLAGTWAGAQAISLEGLDSSRQRSVPDHGVTLAVDAAGGLSIGSEFIDSVTGTRLPLAPLRPVPYDVDRVDDVLDTTGAEDVADLLSDTRCGPEALPQLVARLSAGDAVTVEGTITLIPYFSDRMLQITQVELQSGAALIYLTATALLRPVAVPEQESGR